MGEEKQEMAIQLSEGMRRLDLNGGAAGHGNAAVAAAADRDEAKGHSDAVAELLNHLQLGAGGSSGGGEAAASSSTGARVRARVKEAPATTSSGGVAASDPLAPRSSGLAKNKTKKKKKKTRGKRAITENDILWMATDAETKFVYETPEGMAAVFRDREEEIEILRSLRESSRKFVAESVGNAVLYRKVRKAILDEMIEFSMSAIVTTTERIAAIEDSIREDLARAGVPA